MIVEIKFSFHHIPNGEIDEGDWAWTAHYHNPIRPDSWEKGDYFAGGSLKSPWIALANLLQKMDL